MSQDFRGSYRVSFLHGIQSDRERQDEDDDRTADRVSGQNGNDSGDQQNQGKRFEQPTQHRMQKAVGPGCGIAVGAVPIEPLSGLVAAQTVQPTAKRRANFLRRAIPEAVFNELRTIRHGAHPKILMPSETDTARAGWFDGMTIRTAAAADLACHIYPFSASGFDSYQ